MDLPIGGRVPHPLSIASHRRSSPDVHPLTHAAADRPSILPSSLLSTAGPLSPTLPFSSLPLTSRNDTPDPAAAQSSSISGAHMSDLLPPPFSYPRSANSNTDGRRSPLDSEPRSGLLYFAHNRCPFIPGKALVSPPLPSAATQTLNWSNLRTRGMHI